MHQVLQLLAFDCIDVFLEQIQWLIVVRVQKIQSLNFSKLSLVKLLLELQEFMSFGELGELRFEAYWLQTDGELIQPVLGELNLPFLPFQLILQALAVTDMPNFLQFSLQPCYSVGKILLTEQLHSLDDSFHFRIDSVTQLITRL
jgi:hypothetical protein